MIPFQNVPGFTPRTFFCARISLLVSVLFVFVLGLAGGCSAHDDRADLTIINNVNPESLDPAVVTAVEDLRIVMSLFEGLTRTDPVTARAVPGLASHWEISADGLTYTFHLRTNLVWSTGEKLDGRDIFYSWKRILEPETAADYASQLFYLVNAEDYNSGKLKNFGQVGVKLLDPYTLEAKLINPASFFLDLCAFQTLAAVPRFQIEKYQDKWLGARPLAVSGAYTLKDWSLNRRVRLERNRAYWDDANTSCNTVDFLPIGTPSTALNLYELGSADVIWDKELIPVELMKKLKQRDDFHTFSYLGTYFLRINVTRPPYDNPRVRMALALSLNRTSIVSRIFLAGEKVANHMVPDGTANSVKASGLDYNPVLAKKLLAEAGYPGGQNFPVLQFLFDSTAGGASTVNSKIAVELQDNWRRELGIKVELRQMEKSVYLSAQNHLDYDLSRSSWIGDYNDPNTFLDLFRSNNGNNRTGWKESKYDMLMDKANQEPNVERRAGLLREAEEFLVKEGVPVIPLYFYSGVVLYRTNEISGIYPNLLDLHPLNAIHIKRKDR
jgi:oligopeptide transport system substrate-binding protein